jgi:hypothetical protein
MLVFAGAATSTWTARESAGRFHPTRDRRRFPVGECPAQLLR